jgi:hypothetical protein
VDNDVMLEKLVLNKSYFCHFPNVLELNPFILNPKGNATNMTTTQKDV